jgi:hypothetical protein
MEKKGTNNILDGSNNAFSSTILGGGIGTGHARVGAMEGEESVSVKVFKLAVVVTLNSLNGDIELRMDIGKNW